jgi:hypothetical protein
MSYTMCVLCTCLCFLVGINLGIVLSFVLWLVMNVEGCEGCLWEMIQYLEEI